MKNNIILYTCLFFAIVFFGCVKDNSNTDIKTPNSIIIEDILDKYERSLGTNLTITPKVTSDDSDLSYAWFIVPVRGNAPNDTISTELNLDILLTGQEIIPDTYKLMYHVIDNKTGVFTRFETQLIVGTEYSNGLYMLCEDKTGLDVHHYRSDSTFFKNIYSLNNDGEKLDARYREIRYANPIEKDVSFKGFYLFKNSPDGGKVMDQSSFSEMHSIRDLFNDVITTPELSVGNYLDPSYSATPANDYLIVNGKTHKRPTGSGSKYKFESTPMILFNKPDYRIGGYIYKTVMYDELNQLIAIHATLTSGTLERPNAEYSKRDIFDYENMGNYSLVTGGFAASTSMTVNVYWMLMTNNDTKELTFFKFSLETRNVGTPSKPINIQVFTPLNKVVVDSKIAPTLLKYPIASDRFAPTIFVGTIVPFIAGKEIYSLNIDNVVKGIMSETKICSLDVPSEPGTDIYAIGCESVLTRVPIPNSAYLKNILEVRVRVEDRNLPELKGGVIHYEVTTTGGYNLKENFRLIGGFCDKVISTTRREIK